MNRKATWLLAATLALAPGAVQAQGAMEPQMELYQHIAEVAQNVPDASALEGWAGTELDWAFAHLPATCYADVWGKWVTVLEDVRLTGMLMSASEFAAASLLQQDTAAALPGIASLIKGSATACVAS